MRPALASVNIHPPARATSAFSNAPPITRPAIWTGPIAVIPATEVLLAGFLMLLMGYDITRPLVKDASPRRASSVAPKSDSTVAARYSR